MKKSKIARIRLFSGPNGSGKSTLLNHLLISKTPLYCVVNPDDISRELSSERGLDLSKYGITVCKKDFLAYVEKSTFSEKIKQSAKDICFRQLHLHSPHTSCSSYNAALVAAFIREKLFMLRKSFSFESVFSHPSKLHELKRAKEAGYRIYLYFVAVDDPDLCIARVKERVESGGHFVPENKARKRYPASLQNLVPALKLSYRAYVFDNSGRSATLLAEKKPGRNLEIKSVRMPLWFVENVLNKM